MECYKEAFQFARKGDRKRYSFSSLVKVRLILVSSMCDGAHSLRSAFLQACGTVVMFFLATLGGAGKL